MLIFLLTFHSFAKQKSPGVEGCIVEGRGRCWEGKEYGFGTHSQVKYSQPVLQQGPLLLAETLGKKVSAACLHLKSK